MVVFVPIFPASSLPLSLSFFLLLVTILRLLPPPCLCASTPAFCHETCGSLHIPYPFGLSPNCGLPMFQLGCVNNSILHVKIQSRSYQLLNFTTSSIIIDPSTSTSPSTCPLEADFTLLNYQPYETYTLSSHNYLTLYSCNNSSCGSPCFSSNISKPLCNIQPSCCYALPYVSNLSLANQDTNLSMVYETISQWRCKSYTSWFANDPMQISLNQVTLQAEFGLELDWGLTGACNSAVCGANAECRSQTGKYVCQCVNGFTGVPYSPMGCQPVKEASCSDDAEPNQSSCPSTMDVTHKALLIAGIVAGSTVLAALIIAFALIRRRSSFHFRSRRSRSERRQIAQILSVKGTSASHVKIFEYKDLEKATKGFLSSVVLGNGAHGTVYAGKLSDGRAVAVKRINNISKQAIEVVMNELIILSTVNHKNLVQLLGCCLEAHDPLLVYEFVPNGTLSEHLQKERGDGLDWYTRISIATEAAEALAYLHSSVNPPIYHRDVKSSNILLDYQYCTKVGDFGLSKLVLTEGSHISTIPQGTPGYLDPDYQHNFHLSDKSDVYSFGVVLVEIITAMKVLDFNRDGREINLAALALTKIANGCVDEIIDPFLEAKKQPLILAMVQRVAELAFRCLSYDKDARPTMLEVAQELQDIKLLSMASAAGDQSPTRDMLMFMQKSLSITPR